MATFIAVGKDYYNLDSIDRVESPARVQDPKAAGKFIDDGAKVYFSRGEPLILGQEDAVAFVEQLRVPGKPVKPATEVVTKAAAPVVAK